MGLLLHNGQKRVLHITYFFVTTFFVVAAKVVFYLSPTKFSGNKLTESNDSLYIARFLLPYTATN